MTTTFDTGRQAEATAADFLGNEGYNVLEQNWRTRWCEIDIVAEKDGVVLFVEVKYRKNSEQGGGLEYITPKKLQQMGFAASFWMTKNNRSGDYRLAAIEVSGDTFEITEFIDSIY